VSVGTLGPSGGFARTAADIEAQILAETGGVPPAFTQRRAAAPTPIIGGINMVNGTAITVYGEIQLNPTALSIIMGLLQTAVRDHVQAQLDALNAQLGLPNVAAITSLATGALQRAAGAEVPPMPSLNNTGGHAEGEDMP
jgi:hypothetical protein